MATIRTASVRTVRQVSVNGKQSCRKLHMLGNSTSASRVLSANRPIAANSNHETEAQNSHVSGVARDSDANGTTSSPSQSRNFTSTHALKAQLDSSPIDYAFFPSLREVEARPSPPIRVPLLPENYAPRRTGAHAPLQSDFDVHRPTIVTAAADSTHVSAPSAMSEVHDNNAHNVDFHEVAETLNRRARSVGQEAEAAGGFVKQLWGGFVDDVFGGKQRSGSPA